MLPFPQFRWASKQLGEHGFLKCPVWFIGTGRGSAFLQLLYLLHAFRMLCLKLNTCFGYNIQAVLSVIHGTTIFLYYYNYENIP